MWLRALIGRSGPFEHAINGINKIMALGLAGDAIAFVKPGIEPLRAVGHAHLVQDGINQFLIKYLCVLFSGEIAIAFAPHAPAIGHAVGYLFGGGFAAE